MTTMPEFAAITDYKSFEALALANDADIKTAEASLKTAEMDMKIQKSEWLPNLTVGYRRNTEEGEPVNGMMVGMSFPLYSNSKKIKAARERKQSAEIQVMQSRQEAEASIRSRYQQLKGLQQVLDHSDVKMMNESIALFAKALKEKSPRWSTTRKSTISIRNCNATSTCTARAPNSWPNCTRTSCNTPDTTIATAAAVICRVETAAAVWVTGVQGPMIQVNKTP